MCRFMLSRWKIYNWGKLTFPLLLITLPQVRAQGAQGAEPSRYIIKNHFAAAGGDT